MIDSQPNNMADCVDWPSGGALLEAALDQALGRGDITPDDERRFADHVIVCSRCARALNAGVWFERRRAKLSTPAEREQFLKRARNLLRRAEERQSLKLGQPHDINQAREAYPVIRPAEASAALSERYLQAVRLLRPVAMPLSGRPLADLTAATERYVHKKVVRLSGGIVVWIGTSWDDQQLVVSWKARVPQGVELVIAIEREPGDAAAYLRCVTAEGAAPLSVDELGFVPTERPWNLRVFVQEGS